MNCSTLYGLYHKVPVTSDAHVIERYPERLVEEGLPEKDCTNIQYGVFNAEAIIDLVGRKNLIALLPFGLRKKREIFAAFLIPSNPVMFIYDVGICVCQFHIWLFEGFQQCFQKTGFADIIRFGYPDNAGLRHVDPPEPLPKGRSGVLLR
jgi:hypothetical protein